MADTGGGATGDPTPSESLAGDAGRQLLVPGLQLRISDSGDELGGHTAAVVEAGPEHVTVTLPLRRDSMLELVAGQAVTVRFDVEDDAAYLFDTRVAEVRKDDRAPYVLARPAGIERRPQRLHVRLGMVLDAEYASGHAGQRWHWGKVVDLSAGGLGLITDEELEPTADLHLRCALPQPAEPLEVDTRAVVRRRHVYGRTPAGTTLYHLGLEFTDLDEGERERILASMIWNLTRNASVL